MGGKLLVVHHMPYRKSVNAAKLGGPSPFAISPFPTQILALCIPFLSLVIFSNSQ